MADQHRQAGGACGSLRAPSAASPRCRGARGAVTAEAAVVVPTLVALALGLVWLLALAVTQIRVVDAARESARALAREEPAQVAVGLGRRVAPEGARIDLTEGDGTVRVRVVAEVRGPGGIFGFLPAVEVDAEAVSAAEAP